MSQFITNSPSTLLHSDSFPPRTPRKSIRQLRWTGAGRSGMPRAAPADRPDGRGGGYVAQAERAGRRGSSYVWRAGYWARVQPGYVWVAAHYRWTPGGYVYIAGYWDLAVARRGVIYAPVYVTHGVV